MVQPLRIVDDAQKRTLFRRLRQQRQGRQGDQESIRRRTRTELEDCCERVALWGRQSLETIDHGRAELMQGGERELHLGFHPGGADHPQI